MGRQREEESERERERWTENKTIEDCRKREKTKKKKLPNVVGRIKMCARSKHSCVNECKVNEERRDSIERISKFKRMLFDFS